jgi:hypothetical protein
MSRIGGIVFRYVGTHHSFYYYFFDVFGNYEVGKFQNGDYHPLSQGYNPHFHQGLDVTNLLAVVVQGDRIDFYVNDVFIDFNVDPDNLLSSGQIGVYGGTYSASSLAELVFSDAKVWTL